MKLLHKIKIKSVPEYAKVLKFVREKKKIKQTTIAKKLGMSSMLLSYWESGKRTPDIMQLEDWANTLGMEVVLTITNSHDNS